MNIKQENNIDKNNSTFSNMNEINFYTSLIDDTIASWQKYFPQPAVVTKENKKHEESISLLSTEEINSFLENYDKYLKDLWKNTLSEKAKTLLNSEEDSLLFGGDKFHLSKTYGEPQVSDWFSWILEAKILQENLKVKMWNIVFNGMLKSDTYQSHLTEEETNRQLVCSNLHFEREYQVKSGYIDLLLTSHDTVIAIENKIQDEHLEKNLKYKKDLEKEFKGKKIFYFLLLPYERLESFLEDEENTEDEKDSENKKKKQKILNAFPPITWEEMLNVLRDAIKQLEETEKDNTRFKHWKTLTLAFISFVEGNVLGFPLNEIYKAIEGYEITPSSHLIQQTNKFLNYRKI